MEKFPAEDSLVQLPFTAVSRFASNLKSCHKGMSQNSQSQFFQISPILLAFFDKLVELKVLNFKRYPSCVQSLASPIYIGNFHRKETKMV